MDEQLDHLNARVYRSYMRHGVAAANTVDVKQAQRINDLMRNVIPSDPGNEMFKQGNTLGTDNRFWFRAKFFQQFRLFYRYDSASKIIIYVWVNDEKSLRAYGSKTDAYSTFRKMLDGGYPPSTFEELLKASREL